MGYSGYQPHGQWGNRVQGLWAIGVYGAIGYRGMGYRTHGQWVQGVWATLGNRVQGYGVQDIWATWAMGTGVGILGHVYPLTPP